MMLPNFFLTSKGLLSLRNRPNSAFVTIMAALLIKEQKGAPSTSVFFYCVGLGFLLILKGDTSSPFSRKVAIVMTIVGM